MGEQAAGALGVAAVQVDGVRERLERVEGEAERKDPVPARTQEPAHVPRAHQERQVDGDAEAHERAARRSALEAHQAEAHQVVDSGARRNQEDVEETGARQEQEIGRQDDGEPGEARPRAAPVQKEDGGEKDEVQGGAGLHLHIVAKGAGNSRARSAGQDRWRDVGRSAGPRGTASSRSRS